MGRTVVVVFPFLAVRCIWMKDKLFVDIIPATFLAFVIIFMLSDTSVSDKIIWHPRRTLLRYKLVVLAKEIFLAVVWIGYYDSFSSGWGTIKIAIPVETGIIKTLVIRVHAYRDVLNIKEIRFTKESSNAVT